MLLIDDVKNEELRDIRFVLTDMDETLTYRGRLQARTYESLELLQDAGIKVIPVTAASAGWADQMARMWPVDGVIAENGGLFLSRNADGHSVQRYYWHEAAFLNNKQRLPDSPVQTQQLVDELRQQGCCYTINNLWLLGWLGQYDKLAMSRKVLQQFYALREQDEQASVYYSGDSLNDAPMFRYYRKSLGMSTVNKVLQEMPALPSWISKYPGGEGFVDGALRILNARIGQ